MTGWGPIGRIQAGFIAPFLKITPLMTKVSSIMMITLEIPGAIIALNTPERGSAVIMIPKISMPVKCAQYAEGVFL